MEKIEMRGICYDKRNLSREPLLLDLIYCSGKLTICKVQGKRMWKKKRIEKPFSR